MRPTSRFVLTSPALSRLRVSRVSGGLACAFALTAALASAPAFAARCPNVHVVLDRSGSMGGALGGGTRWSVATAAVSALLKQYEGIFPIGMSIFPNAGCDSQLVTEPTYTSRKAIESAMSAQGPGGSTPSAVAIQDASGLKSLHDPLRPQYVILVTDGGPACSGIDTCDGTVAQLTAARMAKPPINTFVVGFGGGLAVDEKACLTRMADAGGLPAATPEKFYLADNAAALQAALDEIIKVVGNGGDVGMSGFCDDTCYGNGCETPGDLCIAGNCTPNPCSGVSCPADSYCYSDGMSAGTCVKACTKPCPRDTRCKMGACAADPCPRACAAGTVCDANAKNCVADPLCGSMAPACKGTSACSSGKCVDDPCRFIACPSGTRCVPWEGTCDYVAPSMDDTMPGNMDDGSEDPGLRHSGCSTIPGGAESASLGFAGLYLCVLLAAKRRKSRA